MALTYRDDRCDKIRLKETLKKQLQKRKDQLVDPSLIQHHTSEFRRQFKTKKPTSYNLCLKQKNHQVSKSLRTSINYNCPYSGLGKTTASLEVPDRTKHAQSYLHQSMDLQN